MHPFFIYAPLKSTVTLKPGLRSFKVIGQMAYEFIAISHVR